jgi:signal transduction histidine kinase
MGLEGRGRCEKLNFPPRTADNGRVTTQEVTLPDSTDPPSLQQKGWWLWTAAFLVLLSLALAVMLLQGWLQLPNRQVAGAALGVLVVAFCLLIASKQTQLDRLRSVVNREERDLTDMRTRLSEITELFRLSTTLNLQLPLDVVLEIIVRRVVYTLSAQQASVMIYDAETGMLDTRASYGLEAEFARNARRKLGEGIAGWVAQRKEALLLGPTESSDLRQHYKSDRNITSALSLPIRVGDRCIGVLNVNRISHPEPFREHHRDLLRMFSEHIGSVVESAEMVSRLSARTKVLEASNYQLSELNRLKDTFLSTASHELRTPLTSVIGYAEVLQENEARLSASQRGDFLRRLSGEAIGLLNLIDDILDLTRLETGKLVLERAMHSLNAQVKAAVDTAHALAEKRQVELVTSLEDGVGELSVDDGKIRQVIVNLLVNAIKFSPAGGKVELVTRREAEEVVIEVRDRGPGIHPDEAEKIFELFAQGLRQGATKMAGLGIGLHLVRRITEMHGGRVGVDSKPGVGSTFWIRLPVHETHVARAA